MNVPSIVPLLDVDRRHLTGRDLIEEERAERHLDPRLRRRLEHQHREPVDREQHDEEDPEPAPAVRRRRLVLVGHPPAVGRRRDPPAVLVARHRRWRHRLLAGPLGVAATRVARSLFHSGAPRSLSSVVEREARRSGNPRRPGDRHGIHYAGAPSLPRRAPARRSRPSAAGDARRVGRPLAVRQAAALVRDRTAVPPPARAPGRAGRRLARAVRRGRRAVGGAGLLPGRSERDGVGFEQPSPRGAGRARRSRRSARAHLSRGRRRRAGPRADGSPGRDRRRLAGRGNRGAARAREAAVDDPSPVRAPRSSRPAAVHWARS